MTNQRGPSTLLAGLAVAVVAVALFPVASAHGAPAEREIDTRLLLDDDGLLAYGGCIEGQCNPVAPVEGLDVLALDVREAFLDGEPAVVFRMVYQAEMDHDGRALTLSVLAGGDPAEFRADQVDATTFAATGFDRLDAAVDVGDGHPKAIDGWVLLSTLGVRQGDALTGITVTSTHHGEPDDVMPGTWYSQGVEVPHLPHDTDPGEALATPGPATYAILGPAPLLGLSADAELVDLSNGPGVVKVRVTNPLATLPQVVTAALVSEGLVSTDGVSANLDATTINLDAAGSRELTLGFPLGGPSGNLTLVLSSDLGGLAQLNVTVTAPSPACIDACGTGGPADGPSTTAPTTAPAEKKKSPGPAAPFVALAALALAALRRRG